MQTVPLCNKLMPSIHSHYEIEGWAVATPRIFSKVFLNFSFFVERSIAIIKEMKMNLAQEMNLGYVVFFIKYLSIILAKE